MGFNIFLFLWLTANYLLPVLGILNVLEESSYMCCPLAPPHKEFCCWTSPFPWFLEPQWLWQTSWYPLQCWADRMALSWFMPEMGYQQSCVHVQIRHQNCQLIFSHWAFLKLSQWCRSQQALFLLDNWEVPWGLKTALQI